MQDVGVGTIHSCIKGGPLKIERMYTRNDSCKIQIFFSRSNLRARLECRKALLSGTLASQAKLKFSVTPFGFYMLTVQNILEGKPDDLTGSQSYKHPFSNLDPVQLTLTLAQL